MLSVLELGRLDYAAGVALQQKLVTLRQQGRVGDCLLLLEHPPVITLGRNAQRKHLLASPEILAARGVTVAECDRGGDITYHGPGQLVGYPILDLRGLARPVLPGVLSRSTLSSLGPVDYMRGLEEVLLRTAAEFGVPCRRLAGCTGVWTVAEPTRKLAALGVHIARHVTSHGFALNVSTDLRDFELIVPCGIAEHGVTSLQVELGRAPAVFEVSAALERHFGVVFGCAIQHCERLENLLPPADTPLQAPPLGEPGVQQKV
ncbi:MAG: lipoyl(octanoyl) transferase LipB [Terriglobales bacterium]